MTKISRRDFLRTFAAMAAAGTMSAVPSVDQIEIEQSDNHADEYEYGDHECHLCELEPRSCEYAMYTCAKAGARHHGESQELEKYDWDTHEWVVVGEVHP